MWDDSTKVVHGNRPRENLSARAGKHPTRNCNFRTATRHTRGVATVRCIPYDTLYCLQVTADCSSGVPLPLPGTPSRITPSRRCTFRALPLETIHNRTHMTHRHAYNRVTHTQEQMHPPPSMQPCHACCCSSPAHSSAAASSRVTRGVALGTLRAG